MAGRRDATEKLAEDSGSKRSTFTVRQLAVAMMEVSGWDEGLRDWNELVKEFMEAVVLGDSGSAWSAACGGGGGPVWGGSSTRNNIDNAL